MWRKPSLGVIIDEGLKWKDQYKSLTGKLAGGLSSLKKLKDVLPQSKLCDVYHALFESHIRYGNVVWGSISSSEIQALQRLQNRALSTIERARFKDPWPKKPRGSTQHIRIRGGQSKKFSRNPKISLQLHCNPKISAHFLHINLYMNVKYPKTMQIEVRIASSEPRNIS